MKLHRLAPGLFFAMSVACPGAAWGQVASVPAKMQVFSPLVRPAKAEVVAAGPLVARLTQKGTAAVATINGVEISQDAFDALAVRIAGRRIFEEVVTLALVQKALVDNGVPMDARSAAQRLDSEMKFVLGGIPVTGGKMDPQTRLEAALRAQGWFMPEFRLWLETNAGLTQLLGTPASEGLGRRATAEEWISKSKASAAVVTSDAAIMELFAGDGARAFTVHKTEEDAHAEFATVNGQVLVRTAYINLVRGAADMTLFEKVLDRTLVRQAFADAGVVLDDKTVEAGVEKEYDLALGKLLPGEMIVGGVPPAPLPAAEFRLALEARAGLRVLLQGTVTVTEDEIHEAYLSEHGERRRIHVLMILSDSGAGNEAGIARAAAQCKTMLAQGKKVEAIAEELHLPQPAVWIISKNAKPDGIAEILDAAFNGLKKPGDASELLTISPGPLQPRSALEHVLVVLDGIEADQTQEKPLTDALREELKGRIATAKEENGMNARLVALRSSATVEIKEATLSEQWRQKAAMFQPGQPVPMR